MSKKFKHVLLSLVFILSIFMAFGCSKEEKYTKFQNSYFEISKKAESKEAFTKESLEKIIGSKGSKASDTNTYNFESDDESIMIGLNSKDKLDIIKYEKLGEIKLVNCLVDDTNIGGYTKGCTSDFKVDNIKSQENLFNNMRNLK